MIFGVIFGRLQQYFNEHVIQSEQNEYLREAIPWTPLEVEDNQDMIDLIQKKPSGIIATLDSTCVMPKGTSLLFPSMLLRYGTPFRYNTLDVVQFSR